MAESSAVHGIEVTVEPADALPTAPAPAAGS